MRYPERLAVVDRQGEYTYAELWREARRGAAWLRRAGVDRGDCVLVECTQDARYLICDFACNLVGAYFVPVEHKAAQDRVDEIAAETQARLFLYETEYTFDGVKTGLDQFLAELDEEIAEYRLPKREETAEILYTTGTTGKSKGIEVTHGNNVALGENISYGTEMKEGNVELIPLVLSHSHAIRCCYANFLRHGTVVVTDGVSKVKEIYDLILKYHVTAMDLSPTAASVLMKLSRGKFGEFDGQFDYIQIGTAALPEEQKEQLCAMFPHVRLYNFYGSTESGRSCALNFNSGENKKHCIGRPTKNARFIVTDDDRREIVSSADNPGLLACAGDMNMKGYWKQPELTAQTMRDGYIYTNDEGYIDEEGFVYVLGRKDDIINYKGIKIAPEEVEQVAAEYRGVTDCACVPVADAVAGQVPKMFLVFRHPDKFDKKDFMEYMQTHIDGNKVPKYVELLESIPRTSNGKIQRKKLLEGDQQS